ncbi:MarR family transcriptional regulator [Candidatus Marinamargulisbacteria bacterium SCGC AG-343-D04]|nr:MarR family transcriptional regulator [Candidatus Marinamargulisbacteria bacterium SCGC AG-343-D04]
MEKPKLFECIEHLYQYITKYIEKELTSYQFKSIKYSHYEIIRLLQVRSKMTMKEISSVILKHKSTVTALTKKLVQEGYIEQENHPKDKRVQVITLSQKGKELKSLINSIEQKLLLHLHQQLSKQEQDILIHHLSKLLPASK